MWCMYANNWMNVDLCVCDHVCVCVCMHVYVHVYVCICTCPFTYTCTRTWMRMCVCISTYLHAYRYIYTSMRAHTCRCKRMFIVVSIWSMCARLCEYKHKSNKEMCHDANVVSACISPQPARPRRKRTLLSFETCFFLSLNVQQMQALRVCSRRQACEKTKAPAEQTSFKTKQNAYSAASIIKSRQSPPKKGFAILECSPQKIHDGEGAGPVKSKVGVPQEDTMTSNCSPMQRLYAPNNTLLHINISMPSCVKATRWISSAGKTGNPT